jgi:NADH:ubiquinone oxidoreductase subunit D
MPLSMDERGGGTEADGSKSKEYCSHCYANGAFTHPLMSMAQMAERDGARMREMHVSESMIAKVTGSLPSLKRWKKTS